MCSLGDSGLVLHSWAEEGSPLRASVSSSVKRVCHCEVSHTEQGADQVAERAEPMPGLEASALQLSLHCLWGQGLGGGAGVTIKEDTAQSQRGAVQDTSAVQLALWTGRFSVPKLRRVVPGQVGQGGHPWARHAFAAHWVISALAWPTDQGPCLYLAALSPSQLFLSVRGFLSGVVMLFFL